MSSWSALPALWPELAQRFPTRIALEEPHRQPPVQLTYAELAQAIQGFAQGLQALGLQPGERVALFADNSSRWLIADQGIMQSGGVDVVRGAQAPPEELDFIYRHSESSFLVVDTPDLLKRLAPYLETWQPRTVIVLWGEGTGSTLSFSQVMQQGERQEFKPPHLASESLATLLYTSGTTGKPKGVMLSHGNLLHQVENLYVVFTPQPGNIALSLLPTWHSYGRAGEYFLLSRGIHQIYSTLRYFKQDLTQYQPHHIVGVPRMWESIYEGVEREFRQQTPGKQKLIWGLIGLSKRYITGKRLWQGLALEPVQPSWAQRLGGGLTALALWPLHQVADRIVYKKVRQAVGGRLKEGASGGGALARYLDDFYELAGLTILVGYGLTETSPVLTARWVTRNLRYSAGLPIPGTEIKIVDPETRQPLPVTRKGLVLARGPQLMKGYYRNPEATAKVVDDQGWFDTGDLGWVTPQGDLVLTGRAKDTIVLSSGENIEPQPIEDACLQSPYISQIVLVGQDARQLGCLIVPNEITLKAWAQAQGHSLILPQDEPAPGAWTLATPEVLELYRRELKTHSQDRPSVRPFEQIGPFRLIAEPFTIDNGLMTQTLKIKRNQVMERYQDLIREMFV
ncbi:AMP-binding enzyme, putative [Gloeomargarita lithophora Alchichica-D10]|uniref:AMP-binding enzyme, putative n=1 Tax=Gloeomargarita lithophora Alchichica-D10 TaxID=1188229 RepID=A0A1J0ADR7_9CYAN|nr:AMP-binding protein [Gloeomargarita lithophora]APB34051.1 AMP-binding enzyme, putative [Gloeomargarita lithophora Alchichica-D10]